MVLSNHKCMHIRIQIRIQNSRILIQTIPRLTSLIQVQYSTFQVQVHSSNRKVILLILQLETDYFSSYSFQKCSIQSSGITVFTETSRNCIQSKGFFKFYILHLGTHPELLIQNSMLHAEDKELFIQFRIQFYMQKTRSSSSSPKKTFYMQKAKRSLSTSIHPTRPSKGIPGIPAARPSKGIPDIPDIPVIHDI